MPDYHLYLPGSNPARPTTSEERNHPLLTFRVGPGPARCTREAETLARSYNELPRWNTICTRLPERNRIRGEQQLAEVYWPWAGHDIHLDRYPNPSARAKVILLHGVGGNGRLVSFVGAPLARLGFEVIAPDLPLYGLTVINPRRPVVYGDWVRLVSDLVDEEARRDPRPVFLFGLSAGGMLAYQAACLSSKVTGIMATCLLDQRLQAVRDGSAANKVISRAGLAALRLLSGVGGGIQLPMKAVANMRALVNDESLLEVLLKDPTGAGARVPARFLTTMIDAGPAIEPERFDRCPILLVHPAKDRWVSVSLSRLFFDRLECPKELVMLENAGHFPIESPGYEQLESALVTFIDHCLAPSAPLRK